MKRTRLRHRSKTNSNYHEDLGLRADYMAAHPLCELSDLLGMGRHVGATDPHHLFGGNKGRWDLWSNLMALSRPAHLWCEQYKTDGRVLAVYVKLVKKQELKSAEFMRASGYHSIAGWLGTVSESSLMDATLPYYRELVSLTAMGTD